MASARVAAGVLPEHTRLLEEPHTTVTRLTTAEVALQTAWMLFSSFLFSCSMWVSICACGGGPHPQGGVGHKGTNPQKLVVAKLLSVAGTSSQE